MFAATTVQAQAVKEFEEERRRLLEQAEQAMAELQKKTAIISGLKVRRKHVLLLTNQQPS